MTLVKLLYGSCQPMTETTIETEMVQKLSHATGSFSVYNVDNNGHTATFVVNAALVASKSQRVIIYLCFAPLH